MDTSNPFLAREKYFVIKIATRWQQYTDDTMHIHLKGNRCLNNTRNRSNAKNVLSLAALFVFWFVSNCCILALLSPLKQTPMHYINRDGEIKIIKIFFFEETAY